MDPAPLTIRAAHRGDVEALVGLEEATFDYDLLSARSFRHHATSPSSVLLVAEDATGLAGYALMLQREGSRTARLYSLAVARRCRGQGIGARLMEAIEMAARARGVGRLTLEVKVDNRSALALYERRGYRVFGRHDDYYDDGSDALRLEKILSPPAR
ncbi:MAG: GNAT family N-acetyltransferase [Hyphomicrobiales bacterium]